MDFREKEEKLFNNQTRFQFLGPILCFIKDQIVPNMKQWMTDSRNTFFNKIARVPDRQNWNFTERSEWGTFVVWECCDLPSQVFHLKRSSSWFSSKLGPIHWKKQNSCKKLRVQKNSVSSSSNIFFSKRASLTSQHCRLIRQSEAFQLNPFASVPF